MLVVEGLRQLVHRVRQGVPPAARLRLLATQGATPGVLRLTSPAMQAATLAMLLRLATEIAADTGVADDVAWLLAAELLARTARA
ncbi:MAG: hypothetical protein IAG13_25305 [Deltaproteobacteria bacterium]|nr:hypothetical protein [Nannocystaceae bacterium]